MPEDLIKTDQIEDKSKVYENLGDDPIIGQMNEDITRLTNVAVQEAQQGIRGQGAQDEASSDYRRYWMRQNMHITMHQLDKFVREYPDKARIYATKDERIGRAYARAFPEPSQPKPIAESIKDTGSDVDPTQTAQAPKLPDARDYGLIADDQDNTESVTDAEIDDKLEEQENAREDAKTKKYTDIFKELSQESRNQIAELQNQAQGMLALHIRGEQKLDVDLDETEQRLLDKMTAKFEEVKDERAGQRTELQPEDEIDKKILANLYRKIAFKLLNNQSRADDQSKVDEIRKNLGLAGQSTAGETNEPSTVESQDTEPQENDVELDSSESIRLKLEELYANYILIVHQTWHDSAENIIKNNEYFANGAGLVGTAQNQEPDAIIDALPHLGSHTQGVTHKGADTMLIMAFPRNELQQYIDQQDDSKKENLDTIDELLADKYSAGEISEIGLPNKFIFWLLL